VCVVCVLCVCVLQMRGGPGESLAFGVDAAVQRKFDRVTAVSEATRLDVTNTELLVTPVKPAGSRQFELLCMGVGNYTLRFDVTGRTAATAEALASVTVRVHCDIPARGACHSLPLNPYSSSEIAT
jgi:hypothetical protein